MPMLGALAPLLGEVVLPTVAAVAGLKMGSQMGNEQAAKLGASAAQAPSVPSLAQTAAAAPTVSSAAAAGEVPVTDAAAANAKAQKRAALAQQVSLFSLGQASSGTNTLNSLLGR